MQQGGRPASPFFPGGRPTPGGVARQALLYESPILCCGSRVDQETQEIWQDHQTGRGTARRGGIEKQFMNCPFVWRTGPGTGARRTVDENRYLSPYPAREG